jgi:hypothetical protein
VGNYFNQELFGGPTDLPWGLEIDAAHRPPGFLADPTFHPAFLYELLWNLLLAMALIWLGKRRTIRAPGLFALYVTGYSAFRIFEELLRVDPAHHLFGLRLNLYVATALTLTGALWFWRAQRPGLRPLFRGRGGSLLAAGWATCAMAGCGDDTTAGTPGPTASSRQAFWVTPDVSPSTAHLRTPQRTHSHAMHQFRARERRDGLNSRMWPSRS